MIHAETPDSVTTRLREGFERIALVLRSDLWTASGKAGLNPAQAQVLALLVERADGLRAKDIAAHLAVSPPTIADTLAALERKGLVARGPDPADARAMRVNLTEEGRQVGRAVTQSKSQVTTALAGLSPAQQADLLLSQIRIIRSLQLAGAIPEQRMCVSCHHFRPNAHPGAAQPHHCAFVNAAIGDRDLRLDCGEHEAAAPSIQSANWMSFETGQPPFQATQET
ncbi:MAG: MarR family winged helix-turn-helix transcriptional regulator [bacterium]